VLVAAGPARWHSPALSPDGQRLAIISDQGAEPGRWRVFVLSLEDAEPKAEPVSPAAARVAGVCWTPDGKSLVYSHSLAPAPADHAPGMPKNSCDLFLLDLETKAETRLSRGGGFTSPIVTTAGDLYFLAELWQGGPTPVVELTRISLEAAREFAAGQEKAEVIRTKTWTEFADAVLKEAGVPANADGAALGAESLKKAADAFARFAPDKLKDDPPTQWTSLDRLRGEVAALGLTPPQQAQGVLLLGIVEGEYLRGQTRGTAWHLVKGPLDAAVAGDNPFGFAFNPFRPLHPRDKDESPRTLAEVLYRAAGRPIVLSNDPAEAKIALDKLVDPDLARGTALLKEGKGDEADRVLLDLMKRHAGNHHLAVQVGTLLHQHGRGKALKALLKPQLDQLDVAGLLLPRDARLYNLLGVVLLDGDVNKAVIAFNNALRCDLKYGPAYVNLAQAYQKAGRTQDARLCLRRYLKLFPDGELADDARRRITVAGDDQGGALAPPGGP
jgi:tetratricopeptide (TPR) repeat protein